MNSKNTNHGDNNNTRTSGSSTGAGRTQQQSLLSLPSQEQNLTIKVVGSDSLRRKFVLKMANKNNSRRAFFKLMIKMDNLNANIELHDIATRTPNAYRQPPTTCGIIIIDMCD